MLNQLELIPILAMTEEATVLTTSLCPNVNTVDTNVNSAKILTWASSSPCPADEIDPCHPDSSHSLVYCIGAQNQGEHADKAVRERVI